MVVFKGVIITVVFEKCPYLLELHTEIFPGEMEYSVQNLLQNNPVGDQQGG